MTVKNISRSDKDDIVIISMNCILIYFLKKNELKFNCHLKQCFTNIFMPALFKTSAVIVAGNFLISLVLPDGS